MPLSMPLLERRFALAASLALVVAAYAVDMRSASAQQVVARVNGEPITAVDLAQRTRLIQTSTRTVPSRQQVLDELIDEQLKLQTGKRYRLEISDAEVDNVFAGMAQRMRASPEHFTQALGQNGISASALKRKIRADLMWQQIVRGKFQPSLQVRDRDVAAVLDSRKKDADAVNYEYTLRPILFIVPRGSADTTLEGRRREAEGLRNRFQNCDEGLALARGLRDVAIRDPITRTSGELTSKLREVLDGTPVGKVTAPDITPQGVEVFAVCAKKESTASKAGEREVREELFGEKFTAQGKKFLQELRRSAMIQIQ
jgi:peptidyl-prolyl cis-trans isomerase SurA